MKSSVTVVVSGPGDVSEDWSEDIEERRIIGKETVVNLLKKLLP